MSGTRSAHGATRAGIAFPHPTAFWIGTACVVGGVLAHMPGYVAASGMHYHMAGMEMSGLMYGGMALIIGGLALAAWGIVPFGQLHQPPASHGRMHLRAMDGAELTGQHWWLLFLLGVALIIDVMKPATLGFVVPGLRNEYGIPTARAAMLPLVALTGTTVGSFLWGILADRIGRRAAILLASILFIGTSICGFMPSFAWNLLMCFIMGISAGGMLPIVYALMAESIPAKKRGWLVVLHGGLGTVGGYLAASGLATLLEPQFSWRILWFLGLPTGLIMLLLNRWIPESPRFLFEHGRADEAEAVMRRYGIVINAPEPVPEADEAVAEVPAYAAAPAYAATPAHAAVGSRLLRLFRPEFRLQTLTVGAYGLGWGLVNWGFLTFVPTILRDRGLDAASASKELFTAALISVPGTILVAYLYGLWSSRKSMVLFAMLTVAALVAFALVDPGAGGRNTHLLSPLTVMLLIGSGGVIAMLSPYTAEVYPTQLRGTGSGFAAGSSKFGGILAPPVVALVLALSPGFSAIALVVAVPIAFSALLVGVVGIETRDRSLEDLAPSGVFRPSVVPAVAAADGVQTGGSEPAPGL